MFQLRDLIHGEKRGNTGKLRAESGNPRQAFKGQECNSTKVRHGCPTTQLVERGGATVVPGGMSLAVYIVDTEESGGLAHASEDCVETVEGCTKLTDNI